MGTDNETRLREAAQLLATRGASKGGKARAAAMTPEERSAAARKAVLARWARHKATRAEEHGA